MSNGETNIKQTLFNKNNLRSPLEDFESKMFLSKIYDSQELIDASVAYFSLQESMEQKCYELSAGNRKKLARRS